ncbi:DUF2381 family protein [Archangium sp.]|uniref:DUF2381 family protein n=1 Tax=Archangium sp. TaxID=1872627 RepID=UPI002D281C7A|nr:DUF2381 family protein [Archangium sp.]HYO55043.1 DUF2381 family protein [Archangium sp.]
MPALPSAALPLLVLLAGATAVAQPSTPPGEAQGEPRTVELLAGGQTGGPELRIKTGLLTTLLFGAPLKLAGVELDEREFFSRVTVLEDMLVLMPSGALGVGRRLRLKVRFVEGTVPASADFLLVVDSSRAEPQVNVDLRPPVPDACWREAETERVKTRQCQAELEQVLKRPDGLTGLLANRRLDEKGVATRMLKRGTGFTQRPGEPLEVWKATSYRARGVVAVELWVENLSAQPWTAVGAALVGEGGVRLKVLRVWLLEPIPPGSERRRVVVEAEAAEIEARGRFTLSFWQDGEPPSVSLEGVTFP